MSSKHKGNYCNQFLIFFVKNIVCYIQETCGDEIENNGILKIALK
jgi:hypothetical protein